MTRDREHEETERVGAMTMRRVWLGLSVLLIASAYLAGYWPEHRRRQAVERDMTDLRMRFEDVDARARSAQLLGDLLAIRDAVTSTDYGRAQALSTTFFDQVRSETASTHREDLRSGLQRILQKRDTTTAALTRPDQASLDQIRTLEIELRSALGYPVRSDGQAGTKQ